MSEYGRSEKAVGEPDAGNPPVRFDEGAVETGVSAKGMHGAPLLYSTIPQISSVGASVVPKLSETV